MPVFNARARARSCAFACSCALALCPRFSSALNGVMDLRVALARGEIDPARIRPNQFFVGSSTMIFNLWKNPQRKN